MRNDADKIYDETRICAFIGTRFAVGDRDKMSTRMATLGGSIMHGEIFFGVTVARRFTEHPYDEFSDEEKSDMSDDDSEATEIISCLESAQPIVLEFDLAYVEDPLSQQRTILGWVPEPSRPKYFSQSSDWALLRLPRDYLAINFMTVGNGLVVPWRILDSVPEGGLWAAVDSAKLIPTNVSPSGQFVGCSIHTPDCKMFGPWI